MATLMGRLGSGWTYMVASEVTPDWSPVIRLAQSAVSALVAREYVAGAEVLRAVLRDSVLTDAVRAHTLVLVTGALVPFAGDARGALHLVRTAHDVARQSQRRPLFARQGGADLELGCVEALEHGLWAGWMSRHLGGAALEDSHLDALVARMVAIGTRALATKAAAS